VTQISVGRDLRHGQIRRQFVWDSGLRSRCSEGSMPPVRACRFVYAIRHSIFGPTLEKPLLTTLQRSSECSRAFRCDDGDVLTQITFAKQQSVAGCATATRFEAVVACLVRFDHATLFVAEWRVDAAVCLRQLSQRMPEIASKQRRDFRVTCSVVSRDCLRVCGRCSRHRPPSARCRNRARWSPVRDRRCRCLLCRQMECALHRPSSAS
jgi:hypothetical protein